MRTPDQRARAFVRGPWQARFVLAVFGLVTAFFVAITFSSQKSGFADAADRGPGDVALYGAEVQRMRDGYGYYDAVNAELRARGYPTRSVFNWRTPLPVWLIATLPDLITAKLVLGLCAALLVWMAFQLLVDEGTLGDGLLGVVLLSGALLPCALGELLVMPELWSGVLLALSAVCLGLGRRAAGVAAGIAALFFRELAAPYILVCLALSAYERRWRELAGWAAGLLAYGVFFAMHAWHVLPRISDTDVAHAESWIRFGGAGFLISTAQMNAYLLLSPQWVTAMYLSCTFLGCAAWRSPAGTRIGLTTAVYAIAFSIAGHDFNQYWGSMIAPLLCLGASRCPGTLAELWRGARPGAVASISVQR
jgi:hypothetical protein